MESARLIRSTDPDCRVSQHTREGMRMEDVRDGRMRAPGGGSSVNKENPGHMAVCLFPVESPGQEAPHAIDREPVGGDCPSFLRCWFAGPGKGGEELSTTATRGQTGSWWVRLRWICVHTCLDCCFRMRTDLQMGAAAQKEVPEKEGVVTAVRHRHARRKEDEAKRRRLSFWTRRNCRY